MALPKEFPVFWYESNACWGEIKSIDDLKVKLRHQTNTDVCGIFDSVDEFLDQSRQCKDGSLNFGTRIEHTGNKTLREYLLENKVDFTEL